MISRQPISRQFPPQSREGKYSSINTVFLISRHTVSRLLNVAGNILLENQGFNFPPIPAPYGGDSLWREIPHGGYGKCCMNPPCGRLSGGAPLPLAAGGR